MSRSSRADRCPRGRPKLGPSAGSSERRKRCPNPSSPSTSKGPTQARSTAPQPVAPDIPVVASVKPGDEFRVETMDWTGGQIKNDDSANDVRDCDLTRCHHLFGPIEFRAPSRATSWSLTSSTSARTAATSGATRGSSPSAMAVASLPICSRTLGRRSGISTASMRPRAISPECALPGSPIPA